MIAFGCRYAAKPSGSNWRPSPEALKPPNGAPSSIAKPLTVDVTVRIRRVIACDYRIMRRDRGKISLNEIRLGSSVFAGSVEMLTLP